MSKAKEILRILWVEFGEFVIGLFLGAAISCISTYYLLQRAAVQIERTHGADTITVRDTIQINAPLPICERDTIIRYVAVRLPVATDSASHTAAYLLTDSGTDRSHPPNDSTSVSIPITQRTYTDSARYTAWVSGYQPSLDSIRIYSERTTITTTILPTSAKRFSIGLQGGIGITPKGVQPYIGVGIGYKLW